MAKQTGRKQTRGKRTASKNSFKQAPAGRRQMKAKGRAAHPGGSARTRREVKEVVPRMRRDQT
jgi:hypothetical protein